MGLSRTSSRFLLGASILVYLAIFVAYYPPTHGVEDEVGFINQAIVLSHGAITPEGAGYDHLADFREFRGRHVGIRNPGRPILSAPFVAIGGPRGAFVAGALTHVALALIAAALLEALGLSALWAILILWHPTLALYSRTVMGDAGAGAFLLAAVLALTSRRNPGLLAGLLVGAAAIWRYQAGLVLPFLCLAVWFDARRPDRRKQAAICMVSGATVGALIVAWNLWLYGDPTGIVKGVFGVEYLPRNIGFFVAALMILWPLMLIAPWWDRSTLSGARLAVWCPLLVFFLFYYFFDSAPNLVRTLVIGQRLIQPALPALIVSYACALSPIFSRRLAHIRPHSVVRFMILAGAVLLPAAATGVLFARHQAHLENLLEAREAIVRAVPEGSVLLANSVAEKLVGVPYAGLPRYRLSTLGSDTTRDTPGVCAEGCFVAFMEKHGQPASIGDEVREALPGSNCLPLRSDLPHLALLRCTTARPSGDS